MARLLPSSSGIAWSRVACAAQYVNSSVVNQLTTSGLLTSNRQLHMAINRALAGLLAGVAFAPAFADPVTRLPPAQFSRIPVSVRAGLDGLGCTVPQTFLARGPENVVAGSFTHPRAKQWAALCSRDGFSEILIFDSDSSAPLFRFAKEPDANFIQVTSPERVGYSRRIRAGSSSAPGLNSIDDAFIEKASVVWVYSRHSWKSRAGSD